MEVGISQVTVGHWWNWLPSRGRFTVRNRVTVTAVSHADGAGIEGRVSVYCDTDPVECEEDVCTSERSCLLLGTLYCG